MSSYEYNPFDYRDERNVEEEFISEYEPLDYNYYAEGMDWEYIDVQTNDVLFFPGWLTHKTEVNKTNKNRYVMSLNVMGNYVT